MTARGATGILDAVQRSDIFRAAAAGARKDP